MSGTQLLAQDLAHTLREITTRIAGTAAPSLATLQDVAMLLEAFVARHRDALGFDAFPLPEGDASLASYDLTDPDATPVLRANALRAGIASGIHDHGTWAVIVAVQGREANRIYRRSAGGVDFVREAWVAPGQPLVLPAGAFHSIHTEAPALQLHLYGRAPEGQPRQAWNPVTRQLHILQA